MTPCYGEDRYSPIYRPNFYNYIFLEFYSKKCDTYRVTPCLGKSGSHFFLSHFVEQNFYGLDILFRRFFCCISKCIELMNEINNNTEILLKKCDMNKCDPFIVHV